MTLLRTLALTTGAALAGAWLMKSSASRRISLPTADGPVFAEPEFADTDVTANDGQQLLTELQQDRPMLEPGMPTDMSNDADHARPGFADYARGA